MGRYTNHLKDKAIDNQEEYDEYANNCLEINTVPMDIWTWLAVEEATAEEARFEQERDDAIPDKPNV